MIKYDGSIEWLKGFRKVDRKYKYDSTIKSGVKYCNIACSFDIETTSTYINGDKFAFMYEWTFAIQDIAVYGRTWTDLMDLLNKVRLYFQLTPTERLIVYVHNLQYEFQFIRKYFEWLRVFAVDERKPIIALMPQGIELRDSYILSGYSLAKTADNLVNHSIKKLVGDLDYSLVRHSDTPLTDSELAYCENDVLIITAYIEEQIEQYGSIIKIPMTNTGRVRDFVRNNCLRNKKRKGGKSIGKRYRELMSECQLDLRSYVFCKRGFQGGFTHASSKHAMKLLENVHSIDFNSSYPYCMLSEKYPMGKPNEIKDKDMVFNDDSFCYLIRVQIYKLHSKITYESYLSESKVKGENITAVNGRVFSADFIETVITDMDLKIIQEVYEWKKIKIVDGYYFYKQYLPRTVLDSILKLYGDKTELKGVKGKEVEYLLSKGMLNSVYGMCVTDLIQEENIYEGGEWVKSELNIDIMNKMIDKANNSKSRFLYYPWGVWVTAYARYNLWQGIIAMGDDYVYSDTDSIKFLNYDLHNDYIQEYNKGCEDKLKAMADFRRLDFERCKPKGRLLGVFDYEGCSDYFKTLGAKRYMTYKDGKYTMTVAGLSKQNGMEYLKELGGGDVNKIFELFEDGLSVPPDRTGKNTHTYIDSEKSGTVTDYLGNTLEVTALSAVHLENASFEMSMSGKYMEFLRAFMNGYILKGGYV